MAASYRRALLIFILVSVCISTTLVYADSADSTLKIGGTPWGIAYDSGRGELFVANPSASSVIVLSDRDYTTVSIVVVGRQSYRDIYDQGKGEIYVANYGDNTVSVISDKTNTVVATIKVGSQPSSFAYDPVNGQIYVANSGGNTVSVISDTLHSVVANITVGNNPYDLDYDAATAEVFVANSFSRSVSVVSTHSNQNVATITVGSGPLGVAYDSAKGEIFVANTVSNTVSVISNSTDTVVATVNVGASPGPMVYNPAKGEVFVVNRNAGSVSVISDSNNTVVRTLTVGARPYGATYDYGRGEVVVTSYTDGTLSLFSDSPSSASSQGGTGLAQQIWVPQPVSTAEAVGVSAAIVGVASVAFSALSDPLAGAGGALGEKLKGIIPDDLREWLEEVVESRRERESEERSGPLYAPTRLEVLAYATSIAVLTFAFSYVKVVSLGQIWPLLPFFFVTSVLVGFVQKFFSVVYLRSRGVWSEHSLWPLGLLLFLSTTLAFKVPFSSPTRSLHSKKFTERLGAISSAVEIIIGLAFAMLFYALMRIGYVEIGGAGLSMCVLGSFFGALPISPLSGRDVFNHSKPLWLAIFAATLVAFLAWLILV